MAVILRAGHRRWGVEMFGDNFGTTQTGGIVVYVNGALVRHCPLACVCR
jgi:hypothetical protein